MKRDKREPSLPDKEQMYRVLAEETNDIAYVLDAEGRIAHIGPQVSAYGLDPTGVISRPFLDYLAPADRDRMKSEFFRSLSEGTDSITEFRIVGEDGRLHWVEDYGKVQRDEDGNVTGIIGFLRDIGVRKEAEEAKQETMDKLRQLEELINRSPVVVFLWRVAEDWPVEYVSENVVQYGYSPEDFTSGRVSWPGITHPEDVPRLEREVEAFFEEGTDEWMQSYRIRAHSGQWLWIEDRNMVLRDESQRITHVQGVLLDVTNRVEADEARQRSDESFRLMFENATDAILWADPDSQCITNCNRAAETLFGRPREELLGTQPLDLHPPEEKVRALPQFVKLIRDGGPLQLDTWMLRKNGERRFVHISADAVEIDGKRTLQAFFRDITEQKRLEHEILAISDREKETLGHALHDSLGQHLTGLALNAKVLEHELHDSGSPYAEAAGRLAELAAEAVQETRNIAQGLSPVDVVEEGLSHALDLLGTRIRDLYDIECLCRIGEPGLVRDPGKALHLYHIAQEATTNAVRHAEPKTISIDLTTGEEGRLEVTDDGKGMAGGIDAQGGMGLRIMQYRAQMIGGHLTIRPNPKGGTVVMCEFDNR
ncbi:MAG: PAS domain S-box protein [Lentisphaerae bacterium]|nr:PAS domain S-box protein [Lentisphaerota bacterium]